MMASIYEEQQWGESIGLASGKKVTQPLAGRAGSQPLSALD